MHGVLLRQMKRLNYRCQLPCTKTVKSINFIPFCSLYISHNFILKLTFTFLMQFFKSTRVPDFWRRNNRVCCSRRSWWCGSERRRRWWSARVRRKTTGVTCSIHITHPSTITCAQLKNRKKNRRISCQRSEIILAKDFVSRFWMVIENWR